MSQAVTFKSRIDTWVLVVALVVVSIAVLVMDGLLGSDSVPGTVGAAVVGIAGILLPLWILVWTRYDLGDRTLTIHCGPLRRRVPIESISSVSETRSAARSPALSSSRVRLELGDGRSIMISPDNRDIFLRSLELRRSELGEDAQAKA